MKNNHPNLSPFFLPPYSSPFMKSQHHPPYIPKKMSQESLFTSAHDAFHNRSSVEAELAYFQNSIFEICCTLPKFRYQVHCGSFGIFFQHLFVSSWLGRPRRFGWLWEKKELGEGKKKRREIKERCRKMKRVFNNVQENRRDQ